MRRRWLALRVVAVVGLLAGLISVTWAPTRVSAQMASYLDGDDLRSLAVERAEAWGASSSRVLAIVRCETGNKWRTDLIGAAGELGAGQWMAGGAWYATPQYRVLGVDIRTLYQEDHPDAPFWDMDGLAWSFSPAAPPGFIRQWSGCL